MGSHIEKHDQSQGGWWGNHAIVANLWETNVPRRGPPTFPAQIMYNIYDVSCCFSEFFLSSYLFDAVNVQLLAMQAQRSRFA